jgi:hypothetical protein
MGEKAISASKKNIKKTTYRIDTREMHFYYLRASYNELFAYFSNLKEKCNSLTKFLRDQNIQFHITGLSEIDQIKEIILEFYYYHFKIRNLEYKVRDTIRRISFREFIQYRKDKYQSQDYIREINTFRFEYLNLNIGFELYYSENNWNLLELVFFEQILTTRYNFKAWVHTVDIDIFEYNRSLDRLSSYFRDVHHKINDLKQNLTSRNISLDMKEVIRIFLCFFMQFRISQGNLTLIFENYNSSELISCENFLYNLKLEEFQKKYIAIAHKSELDYQSYTTDINLEYAGLNILELFFLRLFMTFDLRVNI